MLNINKEKNGTDLIVTLDGRLDTISAPTLESELQASLDGVTYLCLDMGNVAYISSAGLRVLLTAERIMDDQGKMVVKNAQPNVKEVFDVTGFTDVLTLE